MNEKQVSRRDFIAQTGKAGIGIGLGATILPAVTSCNTTKVVTTKGASTPYTQQPLPYNYKALEPTIDATTMEIHYSRHAANYAKALAEAVLEFSEEPTIQNFQYWRRYFIDRETPGLLNLFQVTAIQQLCN